MISESMINSFGVVNFVMWWWLGTTLIVGKMCLKMEKERDFKYSSKILMNIIKSYKQVMG